MNWVNSVALSTGSQMTSASSVRGASVKHKGAFSIRQSFLQTILPSALHVAWKRCIRQMKNTAQHAFDDRWLYDSKSNIASLSGSAKPSSDLTSDLTYGTAKKEVQNLAIPEVNTVAPASFANTAITCPKSEARSSSFRPKGTSMNGHT